ncbi:WD40 repeat-like protein [Massarina eburnea CBS 473.64]|uniref:WD40 repeat-like protein n=1 Tax=Massarina eburnea CBS 473.64 TaxID=1395130 RepID=A0A6A6SEU3_9PLEO|nr:WD40 repeat-like protein [Massarina eburnea CBS 473.64]
MSSPCASRSVLHEPLSEMLSSSPPPPSSVTGSRKPKKPPPITPRRLTRFFTPRTSTHGSSALSKSGRQLQDITRTAVNRNHAAHKATPRKTVNFADVMVETSIETPKMSSRKRKTPYLSPESSPFQSSPSKRSKHTTPPPFTILEDPPAFEESSVYPAPIRRLKGSGGIARKLDRSFGGILGTGRGFLRDHCSSWQDQTANFYSGSDDQHELPPGAPPFCTAACNTNELVAIGDEDGYLHLLDTDDDVPSSFSKAHVSWRAHSNAIMDLHFSSDDTYIATASGDQTAQIIDVRTQQTVSVLAGHKSSVKQVRFQPGNDKVVATSSRDGAVQIWDLRYKSGNVTVHSAWGEDAPYASSIRTFAAAHADTTVDVGSTAKTSSHGKSETHSRRNDISVTALSFLSTGREHLLMTASDASTSIKLWDIRGGRYSLRGPDTPISTTRVPESHTRHRNFAINSLTLGGDASRVYALSKDNTVYAYSTSHLVLGVSPDLSLTNMSANQCQTGKEGIGPLYGFRHRAFHAGSFYVKAALRKACNDQSELLAVGSTDGCPVLFPTDETFLKRDRRHDDDADDLPEFPRPARSSLSRASTGGRYPSLLADTIPIYEQGTSLVRGHEHEVTSVSWSKGGTLVSVSDDHVVRRWKEGNGARELRNCGEAEGRRWQCGWAEVNEGYDDEE